MARHLNTSGTQPQFILPYSIRILKTVKGSTTLFLIACVLRGLPLSISLESYGTYNLECLSGQLGSIRTPLACAVELTGTQLADGMRD